MAYYQQKTIKHLLKAKKYFFIAVFFTLAIAIGSLISIKNTPKIQVLFFDKMLHVSAYFLLATSWFWAFKKSTRKKPNNILIAGFIFIYGTVIEVLQGALTTYRQAEGYDILANFVGILIAYLFFTAVFKKNKSI